MDINKHRSLIKTFGYLGYFSLLLWVPMFITSLMVFDAPNSGAQVQVWLWLFLIVIWTLPITIFITPGLALQALGKGHVKTAYCFVIIPPGIILSPMLFVAAQKIYATALL